MKFILSQELSRHNRDKKCNSIEHQFDYKSYEISYETIEILPSYTIITPSDSEAVAVSDTNTNPSRTSEIFLVPPISHENQNEFDMQQLSNQESVAEKADKIKSWGCELCAFQ